LTLTTAATATRQFEQALDLSYQKIASGAFTYQQAIKDGIKALSERGIASITYPTGHVDYLDVAFRRATLTGINQTAAQVQLGNMSQMGTDLVETTAHPGARPSHVDWQGEVFSVSGTHPVYRDFIKYTGYGTGAGLCGWNCRHNFFPFFEGLSDPAYSDSKLKEYNAKKVTYNGKELDLYDATQQQRYIERQIRRWKRESSAMDAAGLDSRFAASKVREWQSVQRDFIKQTGLRRDYFRERAGKQNTPVRVMSENLTRNIDVDDFRSLAYTNGISDEVVDAIYNPIRKAEMNQETYINEVVIKGLGNIDTKPALMQIEPYQLGKIAGQRLIINSDVVAGRTVTEIDELLLNTMTNIEKTLVEAVIHEIGHSKLIYRKSIREIGDLYKELSTMGVEGISIIAKKDGVEAIAEIEVLRYRGEQVSDEARKLYERYIGDK
jgi:hypothetical protein